MHMHSIHFNMKYLCGSSAPYSQLKLASKSIKNSTPWAKEKSEFPALPRTANELKIYGVLCLLNLTQVYSGFHTRCGGGFFFVEVIIFSYLAFYFLNIMSVN